MGKKKKEDFLVIHGKKYNVDEFTKEVNKFDKKFGIRLKHPEIWSEPDKYRPVFEVKAELNIAALICSLNGVAVEDYYDEQSMVLDGICVNTNDKEFCELSILEWEDKKKYEIDSLMFRSRFLTLILANFLGRMNRCTESKVGDMINVHHSYDEYCITMTTDILNDISLFTKLFISQSEYKNIILKIYSDLAYTRKKYKHDQLKKRLYAMVLDTRKNMNRTFFRKKFMDDDLCINNILQIAYILCTGDYNGNKGTPNFRKIEGATKDHDLILLIEKLGKEIVKKCGRKYSPMFKAFLDARPRIRTQYVEESDKLIVTVGLYALEFTKLFMNDDSVTWFINDMLKKG